MEGCDGSPTALVISFAVLLHSLRRKGVRDTAIVVHDDIGQE